MGHFAPEEELENKRKGKVLDSLTEHTYRKWNCTDREEDIGAAGGNGRGCRFSQSTSTRNTRWEMRTHDGSARAGGRAGTVP